MFVDDTASDKLLVVASADSVSYFFRGQVLHALFLAAMFQHGYIWAHYLATEWPDMELLYGGGGDG